MDFCNNNVISIVWPHLGYNIHKLKRLANSITRTASVIPVRIWPSAFDRVKHCMLID